MRTIQIIIPILILAMVGCKKDKVNIVVTELPISKTENTVFRDSIGHWHNRILAKLNFALLSGNMQMKQLHAIIYEKANKLNPTLFNDSIHRQIELGCNENMNDLHEFICNEITTEHLIQYTFRSMEDDKHLSENVINELKELFTNRKKYAVEEHLQKLQEIRSMCSNNQEHTYLIVFSQVFENSALFWKSYHRYYKADEQNLTVIWADAVGGMYGMLLGPVGSILEGALFSTIAAIQ